MIAAITAYFNPTGYKSKTDNYVKFKNCIESLNIPLFTSELEINGVSDLTGSDPNRHTFSTTDVMWHKESLINLMAAMIPKEYDKILWLDNDLIITNPNFVNDVEEALDKYPVIQPYERVVRLPKNVDYLIGGTQTLFSFGFKNSKYGVSDKINDDSIAGNIGYAWGIQRKILDYLGLYEKAILDGGDRLMVNGFCGDPDESFLRNRLNSWQYVDYKNWSKEAYAQVEGNIGFAPGTILHLHHGSFTNRRYVERHEGFRQFNFNPYRDIELTRNGCYAWATKKPAMHKYVRDYFIQRKEDE